MANQEHSDAPGHDEHHGGNGKYIAVFVALCVLTLISFLLGNNETLKRDMPQVAWAGMMAVSCGKALLVMLFFMHLLWEANWKYVLTIPASIMSIFLVLMLVPDVGDRYRKYSDVRLEHAATVTEEHATSGDHDHEGDESHDDEQH